MIFYLGDVEEGIGNSHPPSTLPLQNATGMEKGGDMPSSQKEDAMDEGGDGGEKSVLQAKLTNLAIQIGYAGMAVSLIPSGHWFSAGYIHFPFELRALH